MCLIGLTAAYQKAKTSAPRPRRARYPRLLRDLPVTRPNQLWRADITRIPTRKGFLCLLAIMGRHSRKGLSWRLPNAMDADFCAAALEEALAKYGKPDILNTGQSSRFTSFAFAGVLRDKGILISMDGRGRCPGNVLIERLWRSLKHECVYPHAFETAPEARAGIGRWIGFYHRLRPHGSLGGLPPDACRGQGLAKAA